MLIRKIVFIKILLVSQLFLNCARDKSDKQFDSGEHIEQSIELETRLDTPPLSCDETPELCSDGRNQYGSFITVDQNSSEFDVVKETFKQLIEPLYGDQEEAIRKIGLANDRLCDILLDTGSPKGLIVYKKELQTGDLECKTLCLCDPQKDSGKGYGNLLIKKLIIVAQEKNAEGIILTVNGNRGPLSFFEKKGFKIKESIEGKFIAGEVEHTLRLALKS